MLISKNIRVKPPKYGAHLHKKFNKSCKNDKRILKTKSLVRNQKFLIEEGILNFLA